MSGLATVVFAILAVVCGGVAAGFIGLLQVRRFVRARKKRLVFDKGAGESGEPTAKLAEDRILRYMEALSRRLFAGEAQPLSPIVRAKRADAARSTGRFKKMSLHAGCSKDVTVSAFYEARIRLALMGLLAGALFGSLFSLELALLLGILLAAVGRSLPARAIRLAARRRTAAAERHLSEMLEVVALGLRSGLTFDRSFALYGSHFDNDLARSCTKAYRRWSLGLSNREEALREFAESYDCAQLSRIVDSIIRSLRFGSALADILEEAASQSRESYRSALAERVAKAPVKMMLPTGTLILPAMLLLVLGPVLLELAAGF